MASLSMAPLAVEVLWFRSKRSFSAPNAAKPSLEWISCGYTTGFILGSCRMGANTAKSVFTDGTPGSGTKLGTTRRKER